MEKLLPSAVTFFALSFLVSWFAYPLLYASTLMHEVGHYIGARVAKLGGEHHITLGLGEKRLRFHVLGASFSIGWIPVHFGKYRLVPWPENPTHLQGLLLMSGGLLVNLLVSILSFALYHQVGGGLGAEDIASVFYLPLLSGWTLMFNAQNNPVHGIEGLAAVLYLLGMLNSLIFWWSFIPIRMGTFSSDGVRIWGALAEWLGKSRARTPSQVTPPD